MGIDEKRDLQAKFGDFNEAGLEQLKGQYETYQINYALDTMRNTISTIQHLLDNIERLKSGVTELIDGDSTFALKDFSVDECGNIGDFTEEICDELSICIENLENVRKTLIPLQRLIATEDGKVYAGYEDTLDKEEE
jgi:hypothetical protein